MPKLERKSYMQRYTTKMSHLSVNGASSSSGHDQHMYIYELPLSVRQALCQHLDELKVWAQLGKFMSLKPGEMQIIRNKEEYGKSPTEEILKIWGGQYNHTVTELFYVLHKHKLHQAMRIIKDFVGRKYHYLIPISQPMLSALLLHKDNPQELSQISQKLLNRNVSTSSGVSNSNNNDDDDDTTSVTSSTHNASDANTTNSDNTISLNEHSIKKYASSILEINYNELCEATKNWSDTHILGKGGFGTVYRGYWKHTDVAIKLMHYKRPNGIENVKVQIQQSLNELKFLNSCRHDNILPLYGYSIKGEKPCLVYQLMMGGSLEERLTAKNCEPLSWKIRAKICLGTARGINYLHTFRDKPLIHGDIKPANILLDQCMTPKIGDFGLAREGPNAINTAVEVTQVFGTKFYLPPEFIHSKQLSTKVDTFSFGVVVLELFTGMRAYNKQRAETLTVFIQKYCAEHGNKLENLIERKVPLAMAELEMCRQILYLGLSCTAEKAELRPEMVQVLEILRELCHYFQVCL